MRIHEKVKKLDKVCYKGTDTPLLVNPYLVIEQDDQGNDVGTLYASNRFNALVLPVELDEGDVAGPVPLDAIAAASKAKKPILLERDYAVVKDIAAYPRDSKLDRFPNVSSLLVDRTDDTFEISLDPKVLYEMAQSMGAGIVRLRFDPSKPAQIGVEPEGWSESGVYGARGFIMPYQRPGV